MYSSGDQPGQLTWQVEEMLYVVVCETPAKGERGKHVSIQTVILKNRDCVARKNDFPDRRRISESLNRIDGRSPLKS